MNDILIVDDEKRMGILLREELEDAGLAVVVENTGAGALQRLQKRSFNLVITDIRMTAPDGIEILRQVKKQSPQTDVVMMTAYSSVQSARKAFKMGATDYVLKPFDLDEMRLIVEGILKKQKLIHDNTQLSLENRALRDQLAGKNASQIIGESSAIEELRSMIKMVAKSTTTVLINGPSGSGKELVASDIHHSSPRAAAPFVAVNCAAIPGTLLESELFGHEKGAFTGADALKLGRFELAQNGTIFLDEIGEMSADLQAKMLRVLEDRKINRVGGTAPIEVDIRILAATNRNLEDEINKGTFREDLFYRLNVFPIEVPPLASRRDDIALLADFFLRDLRYPHTEIPEEALAALRNHSWPGNVRELRNVIERATILAQGESLEKQHFVVSSGVRSSTPIEITADMNIPDAGINLEKLEANLIRKALEKTHNNKTNAAKLLGMTRRTLYSRMEKYGI